MINWHHKFDITMKNPFFWVTRLHIILLCIYTQGTFALPEWQNCNIEHHGSSLADARCTHLPINSQNEGFLNVLKLPSFSDKKAAPIIIITGGPGTSAVTLAAHYRHWFYQSQKQHDLIFIDQRGTGKSVPFDCDVDEASQIYQDPETLLKRHHQKIVECIAPYDKAYGLEKISTHQAARDIHTVTEQLGYEQVLLWGNSYGTRVALAYQQLYPSSVKAMVLDGVAPIEIALPSHAQHDAERALLKLFDFCDTSDHCPSRFKPLRNQWEKTLALLTNHQASNDPITVAISDTKTQKTHTIELTPAMVSNWVRFILYNRELSTLLPLAIHQASTGNFTTLSNIAKIAGNSSSTQVSAAMHAAILCREDYLYRTPASRSDSLLPFSPLTDLTPVCQHILSLAPAVSWPKTHNATEAPTLLLSGELDPVTPPSWAELAMTKLKKPIHVKIRGGHHGVTPTGCVTDLVNQFFINDGVLNDDIHACVQTLEPVAPFIDEAGPQLLDSAPAATREAS